MNATTDEPMDTTRDPLLDLMRRLHDGDPLALGLILVEIQPWLRDQVHRTLGGRTINGHESLDLTQQAILNFLESGPRFVPETAAGLRALLWRIAHNELIDQQRRMAYSAGRTLEADSGSGSKWAAYAAGRTPDRPSRMAELDEESKWVRLALQYLEPDERYLILASEVEGLDWTTIASQLGMSSPDASRVRAARLKPRLAGILRMLRSGRVPQSLPLP